MTCRKLILLSIVLPLSLAISASEAGATNGMNLEGYGPISAGMGGTGFAFCNGTAAMMNNPATLALIQNGLLVDFAIGSLGPDVTASVMSDMGTFTAASLSTEFFMPALGVVMSRGDLAFGLGIFSQGGMGTEYGPSSWLSDPSMGADSALTNGLVNRSEVGVGRVMVPLAYRIDDKLSIGGSFDFVWAGMDLQMAMSEGQFQNLADPREQTIGSATGTLVDAFGGLYEQFGGVGIRQLYYAYFDFTNGSDFTGQARGYGVAGKIGAIYQVNDQLAVGATYHSKTAIGDLETDEASLDMGVNIDPGIFEGGPTGSYVDMNIPLTGKISVKNFQWPSMLGIGAAYKPDERLMLALDIKYIMWAGVMEDFAMTFTADRSPENGSFGGLAMDAVLMQKWENQAVFALGAAYKTSDVLTLRAGFNYGKNPVPDKYLNALFPAIVENHLTFGAGYDFNETLTLNVSVVEAFEKTATNPGNGSTIPSVESTHSQFNWMVMLSNVF